jgi:hypothetical protein
MCCCCCTHLQLLLLLLLQGPLPDSWGKMAHLEKLALNDNAFKGEYEKSLIMLLLLWVFYMRQDRTVGQWCVLLREATSAQ